MLTGCKDWIRQHTFEMKVLGIGLAVSFVIGFAATGDLSEAFARMRGR